MAIVSASASDSLPNKKLHQFNPCEVADELCLLDADLLRRILHTELEGGVWMKKDKKHALAPNVMAMVGMFNQLALLIPTEVLAETTTHARSKVIAAFIQVASKCAYVHNYNSLKAVLAGLQCTPIFRLNKSWKEVPSRRRKRFQVLTHLMSEEHNWLDYRKELQSKMASNSCFIPFLGVYLSDAAMSQEASSMAQAQRFGSPQRDRRKSSNTLYDTYALLEPITIRHRLEKLRSLNSVDGQEEVDHGGYHGDGGDHGDGGSTQSDSDREDDTDFHSAKSSFSPAKPPPLLSPMQTPPHTLTEWDVTDWLTRARLQEYAQSFVDNGYETVELCANLTGTDLTAIGVTNKQHRSILHTHSRRLLAHDSISSPKVVKGNNDISGSLECLMKAVNHDQHIDHLMVKSSSLRSLDTPQAPRTHKRTLSDMPVATALLSSDKESHRRVNSDTMSDHRFSGLPPQLPLHSQASHVYSPNKTAKVDSSPLKETASTKLKSWLSDHHHKGSFPLTRKKSKVLVHTTSSPVLVHRPRRSSGTVPQLRASQLAAHESTDPVKLLSAYQFLSLGCTAGLVSNTALRLVITKAPHNTEAYNYKLSYQLETDS